MTDRELGPAAKCGDGGQERARTDGSGANASGLDAAGFHRDDVRRLERSLPDTPNLRAAIETLSSDQLEVIGEFVDGFDSRADYLRWGQRAVVHSLGNLSGEWVADRAFTGSDMSALITSSERSAWVENPDDVMTPERAANVRRGVVSVDVIPAFTRAMRSLRWDATEYVNDEDDALQPDPETQTHPAMRPSLSEMVENQRWALERVLDGFRSVDAITAWGQTLVKANYAEMDSELVARITLDEPHTRKMLLKGRADPVEARFFRECFAAEKLLPGFASAAAEVATRSGELAEKERNEPTTKSL